MDQVKATFWEHLDELRNTLIRCLIIIAFGCCTAFFFTDTLIPFLTKPLAQVENSLTRLALRHERLLNTSHENLIYSIPHGHEAVNYPATTEKIGESTFLIKHNSFLDVSIPLKQHGLVILGPLEGFLISMKISFWIGLTATSPVWMALLLRFISPALRPQERKLVIPFLGLSMLFLSLGLSLAYFVTIPLANHYLFAFNSAIANNLWSFSNYIDYTVILLLSNGIAFQLSVIVLFLVQLRIVSGQMLTSKRRHAILAAFVIGAVLTPPDVLTQLMLAIPLIILYELIILYSRFLAVRSSLIKPI